MATDTMCFSLAVTTIMRSSQSKDEQKEKERRQQNNRDPQIAHSRFLSEFRGPKRFASQALGYAGGKLE